MKLSKHNKIVTKVAKILGKEGYKIERERSIGERSIDLIASKSNRVILIEFIQLVFLSHLSIMEGIASFVESEHEFKDKAIKKVLISFEKVDKHLRIASRDVNILLIESDEPEEIVREIMYGAIKYDVALSFAGEQREYAMQVAEGLKRKGIRVFYDEFHKVKMWGKDLSEYFMDVYYLKSRYCMMFISKDYVSKVWPTYERRNAIARRIEKRGSYILPVRFDDSEVPGLPPTISYIDARRKTPEDIVNLFMKKLESEE